MSKKTTKEHKNSEKSQEFETEKLEKTQENVETKVEITNKNEELDKEKLNEKSEKPSFKEKLANQKGKIGQSWESFKKMSIGLKTLIITGSILSTVGLLVVFIVIFGTTYSFFYSKIDEEKMIAKVDNFKKCAESHKFDKIEVENENSWEKKSDTFVSCTGHGKEFYVKYAYNNYGKYSKYIVIDKQEFEIAKKTQDEIDAKFGQNSQNSSNNLSNNSQSSLNSQKNLTSLENTKIANLEDELYLIYLNKEVNYKAKIDKIDTKITKIDLTKHPKPWNLIRGKSSTSTSAWSASKLLDANLGEILPVFNDANLDNNNSMKPIFIESTKTLYYPYRYGKIAFLNVETGDLKWDTFDFEIAQMSLFGGKYYLNEYRKECDDANYGNLLTCNLYEIDRGNLANKKVVLDNVKSNEMVAMADEKSVWLEKISRNYKLYNSEEERSISKSFYSDYFKKYPKFSKEKDKIEQQSDISASVTFEQNKDLVGVSYNKNQPMVENLGYEKISNCPKNDRESPCWKEIGKLVEKYRASLELRDPEFETFWQNLNEKNPNKEIKCGEIRTKMNEKTGIFDQIDWKNKPIELKELQKVELTCFN